MIIISVDYVSVSSAWSDPEAIHVASGGLAELPSGPLSTKTVLGFLDFVTTVSDTVIKFTSQGGKYLSKLHQAVGAISTLYPTAVSSVRSSACRINSKTLLF